MLGEQHCREGTANAKWWTGTSGMLGRAGRQVGGDELGLWPGLAGQLPGNNQLRESQLWGTQEERPASRPGVRRVAPAGAPGLVSPSQAGVSDAGLMSVRTNRTLHKRGVLLSDVQALSYGEDAERKWNSVPDTRSASPTQPPTGFPADRGWLRGSHKEGFALTLEACLTRKGPSVWKEGRLRGPETCWAQNTAARDTSPGCSAAGSWCLRGVVCSLLRV